MNRGITDFSPRKWADFLIYDQDLPVNGVTISIRKRLNGYHAETMLLTMGIVTCVISVSFVLNSNLIVLNIGTFTSSFLGIFFFFVNLF